MSLLKFSRDEEAGPTVAMIFVFMDSPVCFKLMDRAGLPGNPGRLANRKAIKTQESFLSYTPFKVYHLVGQCPSRAVAGAIERDAASGDREGAAGHCPSGSYLPGALPS